MRSFTEAEKEAWMGSGQKNLTLTFSDGRVITNEDIVSESMSFEQSISEDAQLKYGGVSSACFKVEVFASAGQFKGLGVDVKLTAGQYPRSIGHFTVNSDKLTDDRNFRELECYDALKDVLSTNYAAWNNATWPTTTEKQADGTTKTIYGTLTLKEYRDAFFKHIGITQVAASLVNDGVKINGFAAENLSGSDILTAICEANAAFGFLNADNQFQYVVPQDATKGLYPSLTLYPSESLYPRDVATTRFSGVSGGTGKAYYQSSLKYEEYKCRPVTKVQVRTTNTDIGAVVGTDGNDYIIEGNVLFNGQGADSLKTIATNLLGVMSKATYIPFSVQTSGAPWVELGDLIGVTAPNGDNVTGYVLHRTMSGITALKDTYEAKGSEYFSEKANGTNKSIISLQQKTNELERTNEQTRSTITEINEKQEKMQSQITQNANSITAEVSRANSAEGDLNTKITQTASDIKIELNKTIADGDAATLSSADKNADDKVTKLSNNINITVEGLKASIKKNEDGVDTLTTNLEATNGNLSAEIKDRQDADTELGNKITVTEEGLTAKINKNANGVNTLTTNLNATNGNLSAEITARQTADSTTLSDAKSYADKQDQAYDTTYKTRFTQNENSISSEVSQRQKDVGNLSTRITQNANSISAEISDRTKNAYASNMLAAVNTLKEEVSASGYAYIAVSYRTTQPSSGYDHDIWVDSDDNNRTYTYYKNSNSWGERKLKPLIAALVATAQNAGLVTSSGRLSGNIRIYLQKDQPSASGTGWLWIKNETWLDTLYQYLYGQWEEITCDTQALSTQVQVNARGLTSKVSNGDVVSIIEQNASTIRMKAQQIEWEATNSSLDASGQLQCTSIQAKNASTHRIELTADHFLIYDSSKGTFKDPNGNTEHRNSIIMNDGEAGIYCYGDSIISGSEGRYNGFSAIGGAADGRAVMWGQDAGQHSFAYQYSNTYFECTNFTARGSTSKNASVFTKDYGERTLSCLEYPTQMFGDVGEATIGEDGLVYVQLDPVLLECINTNGYLVFLQNNGEGTSYVKERTPSYFVIAGTPGLSVSWDLKAQHWAHNGDRLPEFNMQVAAKAPLNEVNYESDGAHQVEKVTDYGASAADHITALQEEMIA